LNRIQLQSWGALAQGMYTGNDQAAAGEAGVIRTARYVRELAEQRGVNPESIVLARLLMHPAAIQPIIGTSNPERIFACREATTVQLTSDEWYGLYVLSRGNEVP
jgi:predicted oxidoreductase